MASGRKRSRSESDMGKEIGTYLECSICKEDLSLEADLQLADAVSKKFTDKSRLASPKCGHLFHEVCLQQWLHDCQERNVSQTCPDCRKTLNNQKIRRIYANRMTDAPVKKCDNCVHLEFQVNVLTNKSQELEERIEAVKEIILTNRRSVAVENINAPSPSEEEESVQGEESGDTDEVWEDTQEDVE